MKRVFLFLLVSLLLCTAYAQTFVSTEPSQRNVVLEEFTGTNCPYCPDGHRIANGIAAANPGRFWAINIHAGSFSPTSSPNYHTTDGDIIHNNYLPQISGYPCGMINRSGILGRGYWESRTNSYLNQQSCVNVAAQGTLDFTARTLTLVVEVYYTAASVESENFLSVAMVQNNIYGPQSSGSTNPDQYVGGTSSTSYRHMHILRDMVSPVWGEPITNTAAESFFTITYTYDIPENIKDLPVVMQDLEFIVWVAEKEKNNIITANEAELTYENLPFIAPAINKLKEKYVVSCESESSISLEVRAGSDPVNSLEINYSVANGEPQTFTWVGDREIPILMYDTINLPVFEMKPNTNQKITAKITKVNGIEVETKEFSITLKKNIADAEGEFFLVFDLTTDRYGSEVTWKFFDPAGNVLMEDGPYPDLPSNGTATYTYHLDPPEYGCYRLEVYDSYGDGISSGSGNGNFKVYKELDEKVILFDNGKFGSQATYMIVLEEKPPVSICQISPEEKFIIFPNPVNEQLTIDNGELTIESVKIYDIMGRIVFNSQFSTLNSQLKIDVSHLPVGVYFMRITTANGTVTKKFSKQ